MTLPELGWDSFFEQHFKEFDKEFLPARIIREQRHIYLISTEHGELAAKVSGRVRHKASGKGDFPAVGDWVVVKPRLSEGSAVIHYILPRKSKFSRKVAGETVEEQVVVANIDSVFIVTGLDRDFNLRRIERYLALAWDNGANPVIILNKSDICENLSSRVDQVASVAAGVPIHTISATNDDGLNVFNQYLGTGKTGALLGSSGVGKSTIVNRLLGDERQVVESVRESDGRGRHATTVRELFQIPRGGMIIDNPGMRELQLWVDGDGMQESFEEVEQLAAHCRFRNCGHETEPGCAVLAALNNGELDEKRYLSYIKLKKELQFLETRQDNNARLAVKARDRRLGKEYKKIHKRKYG